MYDEGLFGVHLLKNTVFCYINLFMLQFQY